jgi:threonine/homoserine/homoserine lactone efflux protein
MISLPLYSAFIAASSVLLLVPGPNVALIISNSLAQGRRYGLATVAGTSSAMVMQLALTIAGMTALLTGMASIFETLRWLGVAYLLFLGVRLWRAPPEYLRIAPGAHTLRAAYLRGLFVSLTNPKTLLFFGAFLPQFVGVERPILPQLLILSLTFVVLAVLFDSLWAIAAGRLRFLMAASGTWRNRLAGSCYIGAGLGLALARKP